MESQGSSQFSSDDYTALQFDVPSVNDMVFDTSGFIGANGIVYEKWLGGPPESRGG